MKKVFLLICFVLVTDLITGQNIKRYEGRMMIPSDLDLIKEVVIIYGIGDAGNGYYDYYEDSEENRVKHGKFYLKVNGYDINGAYSHGKKVGQWTVIHPVKNGFVFNKLKITYKDDVLWGPCEYINTQDGLGIGTITCNFINGKLTGDASFFVKHDVSLFSSEIKEITSECCGNIDKDGLLQGIWVVHDKGGIERKQKRFYYKGALVYVEEQDFSTGEKTICFSSFNDLKKAPIVEKIKDTMINGKDGIVYEGHIAVRTNTYNYSTSPKVKSEPLYIIGGLPKGMALSNQGESWKYAYKEFVKRNLTQIQDVNQEIIVEQEILQIAEKMPSFPGGESKLLEFIEKNTRYPREAREKGIQGRVFVSFVIEQDGSISNVEVLHGIGGGCDEEAVRVIKSMPKWNPGKQHGKTVRVSYRIPVYFKN